MKGRRERGKGQGRSKVEEVKREGRSCEGKMKRNEKD